MLDNAKCRVVDEKKILDERIENLCNFFGKLKFESLPKEQKELLVKQLDVMKNYSEILGKRLEIWLSE